MKKNQGFTLSELLGVVVILALLMLLVFPALMNMLKEGKEQISSSVESLIFNAAGNYIDGSPNEYPTSTDKVYCLTLQELVDANEISKNVLIDENGKELNLNKKVEINITSGKKSYQMNDNCEES